MEKAEAPFHSEMTLSGSRSRISLPTCLFCTEKSVFPLMESPLHAI
ncbi:hypothetical protein Plim_0505 [Planctopirus limnophila DSM 3776]|uniref:Uncharacterized protein n=1 Tax=Planctopirus limnophila (strain ATCC 43296 / DSM 3776 / IFAM 1008 / Mu 290) TaxID=521674 RepID=D5SQA1_PLAL2|nr:hypothetical protein Plim_0505 [Planctopirus limnophila DSM 3776]